MSYTEAGYKSKLVFSIRTYEIDAAGHVNNIAYVKWMEDLRCELFNKYFSIDKLMKESLYPVVISTEVKYKKQIKLTDLPVGYIWVDQISHGVISLKYKFELENHTHCTAVQKCVMMNLSTNKMDQNKAKLIFP